MSEDYFVVMFIVIVLAAFTIYQSVDHHIAMKRERKINRELMDRLMARDFPSYASGVAAIMKAEAEKSKPLGQSLREMLHGKKEPEPDLLDDGLGMPVT